MTYTTAPRRNQGFLLREEASLKNYLSDLVVYDNASMPNGRAVGTYYRDPEIEVMKRTFPYISIERIGVDRDPSREMRGRERLDREPTYRPDGYDPTEPMYVSTDLPIPMLLMYQVSSNARLAQHDTQITAMLTSNKFARFCGLDVVATAGAPDDNTVRTLTLVSGPVTADQPDPGSAHKRIFRKVYTVSLSSEIFLSDFETTAAARQFLLHIGIRHGTVIENPEGILH